jgi:hypothetical protein
LDIINCVCFSWSPIGLHLGKNITTPVFHLKFKNSPLGLCSHQSCRNTSKLLILGGCLWSLVSVYLYYPVWEGVLTFCHCDEIPEKDNLNRGKIYFGFRYFSSWLTQLLLGLLWSRASWWVEMCGREADDLTRTRKEILGESLGTK